MLRAFREGKNGITVLESLSLNTNGDYVSPGRDNIIFKGGEMGPWSVSGMWKI